MLEVNDFRNKLATKMATRQVRYVQKLKLWNCCGSKP